MSIANKNKSNRNIVSNIKNSTVEDILRIVSPYFIESGYVKMNSKGESIGHIMLIHFGDDDEGETITYKCEDIYNLDCEGFTEEGMITDSFGAIAVLDYSEMSFEQAAWALDIALEHFKGTE